MELRPYKLFCEVWVLPNDKGTEIEMRTLYECDREACEEDCYKECHLTSNVNHAKKFDLDEEYISRTVCQDGH